MWSFSPHIVSKGKVCSQLHCGIITISVFLDTLLFQRSTCISSYSFWPRELNLSPMLLHIHGHKTLGTVFWILDLVFLSIFLHPCKNAKNRQNKFETLSKFRIFFKKKLFPTFFELVSWDAKNQGSSIFEEKCRRRSIFPHIWKMGRLYFYKILKTFFSIFFL